MALAQLRPPALPLRLRPPRRRGAAVPPPGAVQPGRDPRPGAWWVRPHDAATLALGGRLVGEGQPCLVVAHVGTAHEGDADAALRLIEAAFQAGADAIAFPLFRATDLVARRHPERQELEAAELAPREWRKRAGGGEGLGPRGAWSRPSTRASRDLALEAGVDAFQAHPTDLDHPELLRALAAPGARCSLGAGRPTSRGARRPRPRRAAPSALLVGPPAAPAAAEELRLGELASLRERLPRAGRLPGPDRRRLRVRPRRARPRRCPRGGLRREAPHARPQPQGPRLGGRRRARGFLPDGGASAPGRAGARRRPRPRAAEARRARALDRGRDTHRPRRGADRGDAALQAHRRALRARARPRRSPPRHRPACGAARSRPTRRSGRTCSNEGAHHRRGGLRGKPPRGGAARARRRGPRDRQPLHGLDREHRAPEGEPHASTTRSTASSTSRVARRARRPRGRRLPPGGRGGRAAHRREPGQHHRDQRPRHRDGAEARQQEEEEGAARLHLRGLRQDQRRSPSARTATSCWAPPPRDAGATPAARPSTSSWPSPTTRRSGCPWWSSRLFNTVGPRQTGRYGMVDPELRQAGPARPAASPSSATAARRAASPT